MKSFSEICSNIKSKNGNKLLTTKDSKQKNTPEKQFPKWLLNIFRIKRVESDNNW